MSVTDYRRTVDELRERASMFWPAELSERAAALSVIPKLLETQDQFIAILGVPVDSIDGLFRVVSSSSLPGNLFLKHLVVLADFAGESLERVGENFASLFPTGKLRYSWNGQEHSYEFKQLPNRVTLSNSKLGIGGQELLQKQPLSELHEDVIALLTFGSASLDENSAQVLEKCEIGVNLRTIMCQGFAATMSQGNLR